MKLSFQILWCLILFWKEKKFRSFFSCHRYLETLAFYLILSFHPVYIAGSSRFFFLVLLFFRLMDSILFCFLYSMLLFSLAFFCLVFCWIEFSFTNWQWDRDSNNKISENEKTKLTNLQSILWRKCTKRKTKKLLTSLEEINQIRFYFQTRITKKKKAEKNYFNKHCHYFDIKYLFHYYHLLLL